MNKIGERIKRKREMLGLHLNELASKVGISSSALSQIEKSKSFPSIFTLKSIADNLFTSIGELVGENESLGNNPIVPKKEMKFIDQNKSGTLLYLLSQHDASKQMDTCLLRFSKGSGIEGFFTNAHGQVFCHLLFGELKFDLENKSYILKPGDSVYFNAKSFYNFVNNGDTTSELLWIQSPPNM